MVEYKDSIIFSPGLDQLTSPPEHHTFFYISLPATSPQSSWYDPLSIIARSEGLLTLQRLASILTGIIAATMGVSGAAVPSESPAFIERDSGSNEPGVSLFERQSGLPTFDEWTCGRPTGGGGHQALRNVHAGFNRMFGGPRLTMAAGQCYVSSCGGHFFAVCNTSGITVSFWKGR